MNDLRSIGAALAVAVCLAAGHAAAAADTFYLRSRQTGTLHGPFESTQGTRVKLGKRSFALLLGLDRFHLREERGKRRYGPFALEDGAFLAIGKSSYEVVLQRPRSARRPPPEYPDVLPSLKQYLDQPPARIRVGLGGVILARETDPGFDAERYLGLFDSMAVELGERLAGVSTGKQVAAIMADYLFRQRRLKTEWRRYTLPGVLKGGEDACVLYTFVYLVLAERLDLPLRAVTVPKHVFVRYHSSAEKLNIETTRDGVLASDADYIAKQKIPRRSVAAGSHMRSLSNREFLGILLHNRGVVAAKGKRLDAAMRDLDLAASILPRDPEVLFNRGRVFERFGDTKRALADYDNALKWNANHVRALVYRARIRARSGEQVQAFRDCDRAARLAPKDPGALCARGSIYLMLGNLPKAEADLRAARQIDPACAEAWFGLGSLYRRQNELDRAVEHLDRALELDPGLADAWASRALVRAVQGKPEDALSDLDKAIVLSPADPKLYYARAILHGRRLDRRPMMADLRKALCLDPGMRETLRANKGFQRDWGDDPEFRQLVGEE